MVLGLPANRSGVDRALSGKTVERVQTGFRLEKRILKVLKALAAQRNMTLGDLVEGIVLHSFEGKSPFDRETLQFIESIRKAYDLDLTAADSHTYSEDSSSEDRG